MVATADHMEFTTCWTSLHILGSTVSQSVDFLACLILTGMVCKFSYSIRIVSPFDDILITDSGRRKQPRTSTLLNQY